MQLNARPSPKARAAPSRLRGPTSGGAAGRHVDDWAFGLVDHERRPKPAAAAVARDLRRRAVLRRGAARPGRRCRWWSAPTTPPTRSTTACSSLERLRYPSYEVIVVNDGSKDDTEAIAQRLSVGAADHHRQQRLEHGAQHRALRRHRHDRRLHRRRRARRPRLARLSGAALPALGRRRRRRAQRRARRRSVGGAVRGARPGRPDPRAVRRSHRRTRARLQHGDAPRRADRHRRLQPDLPARRRRRRRLLAAAGARLARSASRRRRSSGITTAPSVRAFWRQQVGYGEGEVWLQAASSRQVRRLADPVARPRLQPAAVRARAVRDLRQRRAVGHGAVPVGVSHQRVADRLRAAHRLRGRSAAVLLLVAGTLLVTTRAAGFGAAMALAGAARRSPPRWPAACAWPCSPTSARCRRCPGARPRRRACWPGCSSPGCTSCSRWPGPAAACAACSPRRSSSCRTIARCPTPTLALGGRRAVVPGRARPGAHASGPRPGCRAKRC